MELALRDGVRKIAMPAIGAGLGGLIWADVRSVIDRVASAYPDVDLIVVESYSKED